MKINLSLRFKTIPRRRAIDAGVAGSSVIAGSPPDRFLPCGSVSGHFGGNLCKDLW
jgi:hypothetical protein